MKVLHIIDRLETGGAERLFVNLTGLLAERNADTGVLLFTAGSALDKELDSRLKIHVLNRGNKFNPFTLYKAHRICSSYDIVHTHLRHVYAYIRLAQLLFGGRYKLILHDHAAATIDIPVRLKGIFKPLYYIGVNKEQTTWAENTIEIAKQNVFLLENTAMPEIRRSTIKVNGKKAMLVANIRQVKNIEFAIELCRYIGWQLDIYGNIIEQDYYHKLLALSGNDRSIRIINGITDFSQIYQQYNLAIHCSPKETGPLVLIEYLAAGLPFIAYETGSAAETIAAELPQLFMQNFEQSQWEQRIREIITDTDLPDRMRILYKKKFNPEDYINRCLEIYKSVHS
jgi:glycosyltransferase involved in cell wall biosynthesis